MTGSLQPLIVGPAAGLLLNYQRGRGLIIPAT